MLLILQLVGRFILPYLLVLLVHFGVLQAKKKHYERVSAAQRRQLDLPTGWLSNRGEQLRLLWEVKGKKVKIAFYVSFLLMSALSLIHWYVAIFFMLVMPLYLQGVFFYSAKLKKERYTLIKRLYVLVSQLLGYGPEWKAQMFRGEDVIFPCDLVKPGDWEGLNFRRLECSIPVTFETTQTETFLRRFNDVFGTVRTFVPDDRFENKKLIPGWDFANGNLTLTSVPPLPSVAKFKPEYLDQVEWCFFPVAVGVQGGVKVKDPDTGEEVRLLGYDVFGDQQKKIDNPLSEIQPTPMCAMSGVTGSGKPLHEDTILTINKRDV